MTFDDVLLIPAYSEVTPNMVSLAGRFSRNIPLNIPFVSAAMDTVTEAEMAIAIAREGGIGVIHKNMSIEAQAAQVRKVKRAESGMIYDPVTITKEQTVGEALQLMHDNRIGGIPVVDAENRLIGIVTNRDLRFQQNMELPIAEVMTSEKLVTTDNPDLAEASQILLKNKIEKLPVVDKDGHLLGLITYRDITKIQDYPSACKDNKGTSEGGCRRWRDGRYARSRKGTRGRWCRCRCHRYRPRTFRQCHQDSQGCQGGLSGLDVVVGKYRHRRGCAFPYRGGCRRYQGWYRSGSICTTRIVAGVGMPQLSAIFDAAKVAREYGVPVIADGGLRYSGDIVKALAAGGNCVMCGSMFAGVEGISGRDHNL